MDKTRASEARDRGSIPLGDTILMMQVWFLFGALCLKMREPSLNENWTNEEDPHTGEYASMFIRIALVSENATKN